MPPLITDQGIATSLLDKVQALWKRFYPRVEADLADISDTTFKDSSFLNPLAICQDTNPQEVLNLLCIRRANKAPSNNLISNDFFKAIGEPLVVVIAAITIAYWKLGHYPQQFKHTYTVIIRKPSKAVYNVPRAWRPIALLNIIGKLVKALIANRLRDAIEEHRLLPST